MNTLQRMSKLSSIQWKRHRIISLNQSVSCAAYSVCCTQRYGTVLHKSPMNLAISVQPLAPGTICFIPKRHKSFTETIGQIYMDVSNSAAVGHFQSALISFHDFTGLPWWATIIVFTFGLRAATFPIAVYAQMMRGRLHSILENEMPALNEELRKEVAIAIKKFNWSDKESFHRYRTSYKKQYNKLIERDNCHPLKTTILFWFQIPIWICHSMGIRNIINMRPDPNSTTAIAAYTQLTVGGMLWVPNLIEADASYILPVLWCITNLINIELGVLERGNASSKFLNVMTGAFRVIMIAIIPIAASVPSCLSLYWCTSSLCALAQNLILMSPKVKRTFGIPINTKLHMEHPYRTLAKRFVEKMQTRKQWCASLVKLK